MYRLILMIYNLCNITCKNSLSIKMYIIGKVLMKGWNVLTSSLQLITW